MDMEEFRRRFGPQVEAEPEAKVASMFDFSYNLDMIKQVSHQVVDRLLDAGEAVVLGVLEKVGAEINR